MTDSQLMLLEQLTYMDHDIGKAAGVSTFRDIRDCNTVSEFLNQFQEENLHTLQGKDLSFTQGSEWEAVIRAMQDDPEIMNLQLGQALSRDADGDGSTDVVALSFTNPAGAGKPIVAFRGTNGPDEWADNARALNQSDSVYQKEALDYINGLPYDGITVVGHSKGGNKAQYVTIVSDKVDRCVSMDGQGFSQEFIDKYWAEIEAKGDRITNISLSNDYVHILLYPVPGSNQKYVKGTGMENGGENHSPVSFFQFGTEAGKTMLLKTDTGDLYMEYAEEDEMLGYLHGFVNYALYVLPKEQQDEVRVYLANMFEITLGNGGITIDGVLYTKDNLIDYLMLRPDVLALIIACLLKYIDTYGLTDDQIYSLLRSFGLEKELEGFLEQVYSNPVLGTLFEIGKLSIRDFLAAMVDGKPNWITDAILGCLSSYILVRTGKQYDLVGLRNMIEGYYQAIPDVDPVQAIQNYQSSRSDTRRDFSRATLDAIHNTISQIEANVIGSVSSWSDYASEEWYHSLGISIVRSGINDYIDRLTGINQQCKTRIDQVFQNERDIDKQKAAKIQELIRDLDEDKRKIQRLVELVKGR